MLLVFYDFDNASFVIVFQQKYIGASGRFRNGQRNPDFRICRQMELAGLDSFPAQGREDMVTDVGFHIASAIEGKFFPEGVGDCSPAGCRLWVCSGGNLSGFLVHLYVSEIAFGTVPFEDGEPDGVMAGIREQYFQVFPFLHQDGGLFGQYPAAAIGLVPRKVY